MDISLRYISNVGISDTGIFFIYIMRTVNIK